MGSTHTALNRYIAMKEGRKKLVKSRVISVNFEWFPANPSQIPPTFCQDNEVKPWKSLENYQIYRSFDEREEERKKKAVFGRNSQKLTKSAKRKIGKRCSSQKRWNFMAGDERPGQTLRFEPQQAILWQIWPKSPKKCQMRKNSPKKFFPKFQKRSRKVEKMILSPMEVVSEGGNRGKVAKKEK